MRLEEQAETFQSVGRQCVTVSNTAYGKLGGSGEHNFDNLTDIFYTKFKRLLKTIFT